jgi:hypothetical protein
MSLKSEEIRDYILTIKDPLTPYLRILAEKGGIRGLTAMTIANITYKHVVDVEKDLAILEKKELVTRIWCPDSSGRTDVGQLKYYQLSQKLFDLAYEAKNAPVGH